MLNQKNDNNNAGDLSTPEMRTKAEPEVHIKRILPAHIVPSQDTIRVDVIWHESSYEKGDYELTKALILRVVSCK